MSEEVLDIRPVEPRDRHPMIFSKWEALDPGQGFVLLNDHDPVPLYYQFQAEKPGLVVWDYLESGPDVWQVRIGKAS
ncbi:MAG TPA: DUF2249 domain-containing protein [Acidimicrobiia bacterium]|nr:DUF2249 domain-containing protein [Acidimicrobiia bacterium]